MALVAFADAKATAGVMYYLDCRAGNDTNTGTQPEQAWKTLGRVDATVFQPGDAIEIRRGTTCAGVLWPKGSGSISAPITLGAYGVGALPIIDGSGQTAALRLFDQEFWEIRNVDLRNSETYGLWISGDKGVLHHIHLADLVARHVRGSLQSKDSGAVVVSTGAPGQTFDDVLIDGVEGSDTTQWAGILVNALNSESPGKWPKNTNVHIQNSIAHDVYGDGIVIFRAENATIEKSVAWNTGLQPVETLGTPNGIWTFNCAHCVVQFNEGYRTTSPGVDGGVYDIDYGSSDSVVQYNYGHDADGYCVGVFAAHRPTRDAVVRFNVCIDNARLPRLAFQGDIYVNAFDGGVVDGLSVYNNTDVWSPAQAAAPVQDFGVYTQPALFFNNLFLSSEPLLLQAGSHLSLDDNLYWFSGAGPPSWSYAGQSYDSLAAYQQATGQDLRALYADPRLAQGKPVDPSGIRLTPASPAIDAGRALLRDGGGRDFFGVHVPQGDGWDIGAAEYATPGSSALDGRRAEPLPSVDLTACGGRTALITVIDSKDQARRRASRTQVVFARSQAEQYASSLCVIVVDAGIGAAGDAAAALTNLRADWGLDGVRLASGVGWAGRVGRAYLSAGDGTLLASFDATLPAVMTAPALRSRVDVARGSLHDDQGER